MSLPAALVGPLRETLAQAGDPGSIRSTRSVGGGCINNALRLETEKRVYLLKWNPSAPLGMFTAEMRGLGLLAAAGCVRVPAPLAVKEARGSVPAFLLLEWLEPSGEQNSAALGEQLARLHAQPPAPDQPRAFGLDHDNFIGSTPQENGWMDSWPVFFAARRLTPQMERAARAGRLPGARRARLERLIDHLPALLEGVTPQPSRIHGDLWAGNVIPGPGGLALIDPAVYFADREAEIAYTELFGGFDDRFYAAYHSAFPLDSGYTQRRELYNLYHLLNHLNLFGESYGGSVDAILRRFA